MNSLAAAMEALQTRNQPVQKPKSPITNHPSTRAMILAIGDIIRLERKRQGMSQKELAQTCGISQGTITRAEIHGWISINTLLRIVIGLGKELTIK
jgi:ribosome-binding protein aMBF1 (putative translation factor)